MEHYTVIGAEGDGIHDDTLPLQEALSGGNRDVNIPSGTYLVKEPIRIGSHTHIHADKNARLIFRPDRPMVQSDFLLTNDNFEHGNEDILVEGGIWDGGFGGKNNTKHNDLFKINTASGACLNFLNVHGLILSDLEVTNSVVYFIRMARLWDFTIRNIGFSSRQLAYNQDGLHFGGDVHNGVVENIHALTKGQTNDDMIALNADDSIQRLENRGLCCGPIENIVFRNIYAEDCYTAIRMLSITAPIRHITIENIYAGCRYYAINMDAARYCRTPLFSEDDAVDGVGCIEDVHIRNMTVYASKKETYVPALIRVESHCSNVSVEGFIRDFNHDAAPSLPTLMAKNLTHQRITFDGKNEELHEKSQSFIVSGALSSLLLTDTDAHI